MFKPVSKAAIACLEGARGFIFNFNELLIAFNTCDVDINSGNFSKACWT